MTNTQIDLTPTAVRHPGILYPGIEDDDTTVSFGALPFTLYATVDDDGFATVHIKTSDTDYDPAPLRVAVDGVAVFESDVIEHIVDGTTVFAFHGHMKHTRAAAAEARVAAVAANATVAGLEAQAAAAGVDLYADDAE